MKKSFIALSIVTLFLFSCKKESEEPTRKLPERKEPKNLAFTLENSKDWLEKNNDK